MGVSPESLTGALASSATSRRVLLSMAATSLVHPPRVRAAETLTGRILADRLMPPSASGAPSAGGDLRYPAWLAGTWRVTNTNGDPAISLPLGPRFVDPLLIEEAQRRSSRRYLLRYVDSPTDGCGPPIAGLSVRQDRRFNAIQEEGAFIEPAGFVVEGGTYMCDSAHPHGMVKLSILDQDATAGLRDRGDASTSGTYEVLPRVAFRSTSELDVVWAAWEPESDVAFVTSELVVQRELLPTGETLATTFLEQLTRFERPSADQRPAAIKARYRVVVYLSLPGVGGPRTRTSSRTREERALEKDARGQAVAMLDYELAMVRV